MSTGPPGGNALFAGGGRDIQAGRRQGDRLIVRPMLESTNALIAATLAFVGGHFLLSSRPLRPWLNERFGERAYRLINSVAMTVALLWVIAAYGAAPREIGRAHVITPVTNAHPGCRPLLSNNTNNK